MAYYLNLVKSVVSARSPLSDFPYTVGEVEHEVTLWKVHTGTKKSDHTPVTIFAFNNERYPDASFFNLAKNAFKRAKTIRHPNLLKYVDGIELENTLYIVTEKVKPLSSITYNHSEKQDNNLLAWGLFQVLNGIKFLNEDCSFSHGSICISSIYVDGAGEWKLFGYELLSPAAEENSTLITCASILSHTQKYTPPEVLKNKGWAGVNKNPPWATDMWFYGCLIYETHNSPFSSIDEIKNKGNIPANLFAIYKDIMKGDPKSRISPSQTLQKMSMRGEYFFNEFIQATQFLENFALKESHEKDQFFRKLAESLESFPDGFCKNKILPELVKALEFGSAGSKALAPLLKIGERLNSEEYETYVVSAVVKLFAQTDRAMRMSLLETLPSYIDHLSPKLINEKIFVQVSSSFLDPTPALREQAVKSMVLFAPKLNEKIINNELLRYFAKCQMDEVPGIRTNTTICLGRVASYLSESTKKRVLIPAFSRALRDPFPPARNAGLLAFTATISYYNSEEIATKILPTICPLLIDPEQEVRTQSFKSMNSFLTTIEGRGEVATSGDQKVEPSGQATGAESWGWNSISSALWFKKTGETGNEAELKKEGSSQSIVQPSKPAPEKKAETEGWDVEDDGLDNEPVEKPVRVLSSTKSMSIGTSSQNKKSNQWDNDFEAERSTSPVATEKTKVLDDDDDVWAPMEETEEEKNRKIEETRRKQAERKERRLKMKESRDQEKKPARPIQKAE